MKSPFTGGETELIRESKLLEFRKESFEIILHSYRCIETGEYFTTEKMDQVNITQVHNKYREKHNIPFPDQIIAIRDKYGLSASKMSEILGFGINTYRNYEGGEVPQASNGKLIKLAANPEKFKSLVELSDSLSQKEQKKILDKIDLIIEQEIDSDERLLRQLLSYKFQSPNVFTGYRDIQFEKFSNMIIYFAETIQPFKTKLNKLLFYSDFLNYKKTGFSISGCNYRAIELGPVPHGYDTLFEYFKKNEFFNIDYIEFDNQENIDEQFVPNPQKSFDKDLFTKTEIECLNSIASYFKDARSEDIINASHKERAWEQREKKKELIEYDYAFDLSIN